MSDLISTTGLTKTGRPYVIFDNVFNDEEVNRMMLEMDLVLKPMMRREDTSGTNKKNTNAMFLHEAFSNQHASNIFKATRKYFTEEMLNTLYDSHWVFKSLKTNIVESIQVLYYEDNDNYGQHEDLTLMTILYWCYKQPKGFEGGDLVLDDDVVIECKHNRALAMSITLPHEVIPVKYTATEPDMGRYCISNFYNLNHLNIE